MDKFRYHLRKLEWGRLTTLKAKNKFIREVFHELEENLWYGVRGPVTRAVPVKQSTLQLRLIRTCFCTYDTDRLPGYIPATVAELTRR